MYIINESDGGNINDNGINNNDDNNYVTDIDINRDSGENGNGKNNWWL